MANDIFPGVTYRQLPQWGFPMGSLRPVPNPSLAYSVIHWTAGTATAESEVALRSDGSAFRNNATFWVNRNGSIVQTLGDPLRMAPWTNGVPNNPDLSNPRIAAVVAAGVNPNYRSLITIEIVAAPGYPITPAQEVASAALIRYYHAKIGMAVNRQTVIGHYQITATTCPGNDKAVVDRIVALATGGEPVLTLISFPDGPHTCEIAAGATVHGWTAGPAPAPAVVETWASGSSFLADVKVEITQPAGGFPQGTFFHAANGTYAGLYVPIGQVTDAGPLAPSAPTGFTQDDIDDAVAIALSTQLPSAKAEAATAVAEAAVAKAEEF